MADDAVCEAVVVGDGGVVKLAALWLDACPCDGEAEEFAAEGGGGGDVFFVAV